MAGVVNQDQQLEKHKYITKNSKTGEIGRRYHTSIRCTSCLGDDTTMIKAPASLLRFYGITEKCRICEARDSKKIDSELDLKPLLSVILNLAIVLEKGMSREEMRSLSIGYEIPFSLRTNKPYFARALAKYWLRSMDYKSILKYVEVCRVHYQQLIDKDDRHFPDFNIEMVERCVRAVRHINKIKKMNKENQNG